MTAVARRTGSHVSGWFTGGLRSIVATGAGAGDGTVIDMRWFPGRTGMAVTAGTGAGDMGGRLARGGCAVVTAGAGTGDLTMIEIRY